VVRQQGGQQFLAFSGPELLGLVVLWERYGDDWNKQSPNIYEDLVEKLSD
jgi:hypothetical protein